MDEDRKLWGPRITAALCVCTRDEDRYWHRQPSDHGPDGLFVGGPHGEQNPIARLQKYTHCETTASTPENERKQLVTTRGRVLAARRASESAPVMLGRFLAPRKPANSGRRKKVA